MLNENKIIFKLLIEFGNQKNWLKDTLQIRLIKHLFLII
jgi:hypothetical protein